MILVLAIAARAADVDADGVAALEIEPPMVAVDADLRASLDAGELYTTIREGEGGLGMIVANAPPSAVWSVIVDFDRYVDFLPYVTGSSVDARTDAADHSVIDCTMELTTKGFVTRYTVRNTWWTDAGWMGFVMLPQPGNPLRQATGYWRVEAWNGDPNRSLVTYQVDATADWWVPAFVRSKATDNAVPRVIKLVAKRAEGLSG